MPGLNRNLACMTRVLVPPGDVLDAFDKVIEPLSRLGHANEIQSYSLAVTRDALLPKLLSGEIRVKDAERLVERAV